MKVEPFDMGTGIGKIPFEAADETVIAGAVDADACICSGHTWIQRTRMTGSEVYKFDTELRVRGTLQCSKCGGWSHLRLDQLFNATKIGE